MKSSFGPMWGGFWQEIVTQEFAWGSTDSLTDSLAERCLLMKSMPAPASVHAKERRINGSNITVGAEACVVLS